jgi:bifunctional ADP-heptose synthase (sugar kinase/adenylyltransferase)
VKARGGRVLLAVLEEGQSTSAIVRRAGAKRS